jgi:aerobic carbon-monoxide dehydrogenase large subunit
VKWVADRSESFLTDAHGRDHVTTIELATDKQGNFLALRTETLANVGAYLSNFATVTPTFLHGTLMAGPYKTPLVYVNVKTVFTNTAPVDAYRGAGRPEATYSIERVVDKMCRELGLDPVAVRRQNFIQPDQFPYQTPVGLVYDTGNYGATLDKLMTLGNVSGFEARRAKSAAKGKLRGFGLSTWVEACGIAPSALVGALGARVGLYDAATVRVNPTGNISVMVGAHSHGQGHETVFAQIVSSKLGIPEANVDIVHGDTSKIPFGMGSYGSRSLAVCGVAMDKALDKVIAKGKKIAAHMLEAAEGDIVFEDGKFSVTGTDKAKTFGEIAFSAYVPKRWSRA